MASSATMSRARSGLILPRFGTPRNLKRETLGGGVATVAEQLGMPLMPWQRHVVDVALELDPKTGELWYRQVNLAVPRQNGKTSLGMAVKTHRCTRWGGKQSVVYIAQTRDEARKKFVDEHEPILRASPIHGKAYDLRLSNGSEHIKWANGSRWGILAPTRKAGHGVTIDLVEFDEAFSYQDNRSEQALRPAMITRPSRQVWVVSTAGDAESYYWWQKISAGRVACENNSHGRTAFFEWSADDDADPGDEAVWRSTIPALGHTITLQAIREEWETAQRDGIDGINLFRRAYLNQWPEIPVLEGPPAGWQVIGADEWRACLDARSALPSGAPVAFAVDVTPDRTWASISAAGVRPDGAEHLEVVEHRHGTGWVVDWLAERVKRWPVVAVALDPKGPAGSLVDDLLARLPADMLVQATAGDQCQAAAALLDAIDAGTVRHLGQHELDAAAEAARKRPIGDAWAWTRSGTTVPISPLVSTTLARWALRRPRKTKPVFAY